MIYLDNGTIQGELDNSGLIATFGLDAIFAGNGSTIGGFINRSTGIIRGGISRGMRLSDSSVTNDLINQGLIDGGEGGVILENSYIGGALENSGEISSSSRAISMGNTIINGGIDNSGTIEGVAIESSSTINGFSNSGTITGASSSGVGVEVADSTINSQFMNNGTISGSDFGLVFSDVTLANPVVNDGTIEGGLAALAISALANPIVFENNGDLNGNVIIDNTTLNINNGSNLTGYVTGTNGSQLNIFTDLTAGDDYEVDAGILIDTGAELSSVYNFTSDNFVNRGALTINPTGTTTVTGNYTQQAGSVLNVVSTSETDYSKLDISGNRNFANGSIINLDVRGTSYAPNTVLSDVVRAGNLTAGSFSVTDNSFLYDFLGVVNGNSIDLAFASTGSTVESAEASEADRNTDAARAIDEIIASGNAPEIGTAFASLGSAEEVSNAVATTVPTTSSASSASLINTMDTVGRIVQSRDEANLGLSSGDGVISDGYVWFKPFASWSNQDSNDGIPGFDGDTQGIVAGIDGVATGKTRLGVAVAYANSDLDSSGFASQSIDIDSYQLAFYGSHSLDARTSINFQTDVGYNNTDSNRLVEIGGLTSNANADFDSWALRVGTGIGRTYPVSAQTTITPSARVDYSLIRTDDYTETGAGALNLSVDSETTDQLIPAVEAKVQHQMTDRVALTANGGVGYDVLSDDSTVTSSFVGGGSAFTTTGLEPSPWVVRGGLGFTYQASDMVNITARYDRENRGEDFDNNTVSLKARILF